MLIFNEVHTYAIDGCVCSTINCNVGTSAYKLAFSYSWQSVGNVWKGTTMVWPCSPLATPMGIAMDNVALYIFLCLELCYYKYAHLLQSVLAMHALLKYIPYL